MHRGYFDASFSEKGSKAGIYIKNKKGKIIFEETIILYNVKSSMEAEYAALLQLLRNVVRIGIVSIKITGDCLSIIEMMKRKVIVKQFEKFMVKIFDLLEGIKRYEFHWVYRQLNTEAHKLAAKKVRGVEIHWTPMIHKETQIEKKPSLKSMIRNLKKRKYIKYAM